MAGASNYVDSGTLVQQAANMQDRITAHGQSLDSMQTLLYGNQGQGFWGAMSQFLQSGDTPKGFAGHIYNFIVYVLLPVQDILSVICLAIGVILIAFAVYRLREHSAGNAARQKSFIATVFYFIAGSILITYNNILGMLSETTFFGFYGDKGGFTDSVMTYASNLGASTMTPGDVLQQLTFALLLVVGLFSFLRGIFLMIKLGEGGGAQESILSKSIAHIVAGVVGVNASAAWHMMSYITGIISGS